MSPAPAPGSATIVIPTYGQAERLGDAIASALAQTHAPLEVLVMDDASPDQTPAVIDRHRADPRLRAIRHPANLGRVANYRAGLAAATGRWVLMLDGDDALLDPGFVAAAVARAARDPGIVLVVGGQRWRDVEDGRRRDLYPTAAGEEPIDGWRFFLRWVSPHAVVPHLAALYRADVAREIGFYAHDVLSSDWESLRRLILRGRVLLLRRLAGEWRGHDRNVSRRLDPRLHLDNLVAILGPWEEAVRLGRGGVRLAWWKWDALQRAVAIYLEAAASEGDAAAAAAYRAGLGERLGAGPATALVTFATLTRPSLWLKAVLARLGGRGLLARARRAWHRLSWDRG